MGLSNYGVKGLLLFIVEFFRTLIMWKHFIFVIPIEFKYLDSRITY